MADRFGNVWIGRQRELATMAHAAAKTMVTVEKIHDGNLMDQPTLAAGTLPGFYVDSIAVDSARRLAVAAAGPLRRRRRASRRVRQDGRDRRKASRNIWTSMYMKAGG